jgi:hypothetical protein
VIVLLLHARVRKPVQLAQRSTLEERLQRLAQLREQGLISDEVLRTLEYELDLTESRENSKVSKS